MRGPVASETGTKVRTPRSKESTELFQLRIFKTFIVEDVCAVIDGKRGCLFLRWLRWIMGWTNFGHDVQFRYCAAKLVCI